MNFIRFESAQKLRGGYYTPGDLAAFISRWIAQSNPERVLEPSCGDGAFFEALQGAGVTKAKLIGFELDANEAAKASARAVELGLDAEVHALDFLGWALDELDGSGRAIDAVVGNPPFIRYQYLPTEFQDKAEAVFDHLKLKFTKHTNAWVPFILASIALLKPGGRLGMVVPAEIVHVMHAQPLRTYLGSECRRLVVIDPEEIWFEDTLQGAVILLAEKLESKSETSEGLGIQSVRGRGFTTTDPASVFAAPQAINGKTVEGKWTRALLEPKTLALLDELEASQDISRFHNVAEVDVGIVTGANKFFLVPDETVEEYGLHTWAKPMFGRSEHCPGVIYDWRQHQANAEAGLPTNFIFFPDASVTGNAAARAYIAEGERQDLHTRFKCRVRKPWFTVPSVSSAEIGMLKRAHDTPRLILNRAAAYTTDTAYRIRTELPADHLVCSFLNPLTALSAELEGRHYGGGVLELVPSEIERLLVLTNGSALSVEELDEMVRSRRMPDVIDVWGWRVLEPLGLSRAEHRRLLGAWRMLRDRRQRVPGGSPEAGD